MSEVVAVLGGTGFVGGAVVSELESRGVAVRSVAAPRLRWQGSWVADVPAETHRGMVDAIAEKLDGVRVVINAAGIAAGDAPAGPELYGANALLPLLVARACAAAGVDRFVQVSSAAAQGAGDLDETPRTAPFSPYSQAKALGENLLLRYEAVDRVIFRSTWVHGAERANTRSLVRVARSRMSCVAGDGCAPTPQVLIGDVAAALAHLALEPGPVPPIVLQPPSGMTTGLILRLLSGREPRHLHPSLARALAGGVRAVASAGTGGDARRNAYARRLEMLLFGKRQTPGWLAGRGVVGPLDHAAWQRLGSTPASWRPPHGRVPATTQESTVDEATERG